MNNGAWFFFFSGAVFGVLAMLSVTPVLFARLIARRLKRAESRTGGAYDVIVDFDGSAINRWTCTCPTCERARREEGKRN
jgi:hypothetical protein